jgi:hypothetical protein
MSINRRNAVAYLVASTGGLVALYLLVISSGYVSSLIDPTARICSFLLILPRHPVRLAAASLALHLSIGAVAGSAVSLLSAWAHDRERRLIWLLFISGFLISLVISAPPFHSWPWKTLTQIAEFVAASAAMIVFPWRTGMLRHSKTSSASATP